MKSDWLLIFSVLCLGFGLGVLLGYCTDHSSFAAAYPLAGSMLHVDFTTVGPGVLGGLALTFLGGFRWMERRAETRQRTSWASTPA